MLCYRRPGKDLKGLHLLMKRLATLAAFAAAAMIAMPATATAQYVSDAEAFLAAVEARDGDKVTEFLQSRPTIVNSRNAKGQTALVTAISRRDNSWTGFLLSKGADPNLAGVGGETPLIAAARIGFTDAVELLLQLDAEVDRTNRMGETALIVAVQRRQVPIVRQLLAAGADPDKTDTAAGYSARDYARRDTRSRELLRLIEEGVAKPDKADDLNSFKLK